MTLMKTCFCVKKTQYQSAGINLTPTQLEKRDITTLNGVISITRRRLRPVDRKSRELLFEREGVKSIAPLDHFLGIDKLPFKMTAAVMLKCAYWAQDQASFQRAEEKLKKTIHVSIDDDTVRKAAGYIGKAVFEADCRRAEAAWTEFCTKPMDVAPLKKKGGALYRSRRMCSQYKSSG